MSGMVLLVVGGIIFALGLIVAIVSVVFELTKASRIKRELKNEYF